MLLPIPKRYTQLVFFFFAHARAFGPLTVFKTWLVKILTESRLVYIGFYNYFNAETYHTSLARGLRTASSEATVFFNMSLLSMK